MKIVLLTEFFPRDDKFFTGGVEVRVIRLYRYLKSKGHEVTVVSRSGGYDFNSFLTSVKRLSFFINLIVKIVFTNLPPADVVEGTNFTTYILAFFYAKKIKAKAFAWYPDVFVGKAMERLGLVSGLLTEIAERISLKLPWDKVIALSQETKKKLIEAGVPEGKIKVIYGGVELNSEFPARSGYAAGVAGGRIQNSELQKFRNPTILCIARLVKYKRISDLILAVYLLKDRFPDIRLIIVGEGPQRNNFKFQISNFKLQNHVEMIGKISEEDKINLLAKSHIHVLPSAVEGFGLVTIEALSAGTPVVNADIPINREILDYSSSIIHHPSVSGGLLYDLGDYVDLAEKLEDLLTDQELYDRKVKEGIELVKKYDWDKVNKEYEHLLSN